MMSIEEIRKLPKHIVTWQQKWILQYILEQEEKGTHGITNQALADALGTSYHTIRKQLSQLVKKGYITRRYPKGDRRRRELHSRQVEMFHVEPSRQRKAARYYCDNQQLLKAIEESKQQGKPTPEFGQIILDIVEHYTPSMAVTSRADHAMCQSSATEYGLKIYDKFDPSRGGNAFAYASTAVRNGYLQGIRELRENGKWKSSKHINIDDAFNQ